MGKFLSFLLVVGVIGGLAFLNWDRIEPIVGPMFGIEQAAPVDDAPTEPVALEPAPEPLVRLALLDPTLSTDASFRESMKSILVSSFDSLVPPKPESTLDGVPAVAGVQFVLRLVGNTPLKVGAADIRIDVPSVGALPARPDLEDEDALTVDGSYNQWVAAEKQWQADYDAALAAAKEGAATLQALDLNLDEWSAVTAGVTALALTAPVGGDARMLVMSDLDENLPQQSTDLHGVPIDVVQPDATGDLATWNGLFSAFSGWATASGSGPVTQHRPEAAPAVITEFLTGD